MGKASYIGVSSKAHKIKKGYIGVGGKARKIKKAYIGVNGKARLWWSGLEGKFLLTAAYSYTQNVIINIENNSMTKYSNIPNMAQPKYGGGKYWGVSYSDNRVGYYSSDGINWTSFTLHNIALARSYALGIYADDTYFYVLHTKAPSDISSAAINPVYSELLLVDVKNPSSITKVSAPSSYPEGTVTRNIVSLGSQERGNASLTNDNKIIFWGYRNFVGFTYDKTTKTLNWLNANTDLNLIAGYGYGNNKTAINNTRSGYYLIAYYYNGNITYNSPGVSALQRDAGESICFGNGIFVILTYRNATSNYTKIRTSTDLINFSEEKQIPVHINSLCYGDGKWLAFNGYNYGAYISDDLETWTYIGNTGGGTYCVVYDTVYGFGDK